MKLESKQVFISLLLMAACASANDQHIVVSHSNEKQLAVMSVTDNGKFKLQSKTSIDARPAACSFDSTGRHLYVACSGPDSIAVLQANDKGLTPLQSVTTPAKPSAIAITPSGRFLVASYYKTGQVTVHGILSDGRLSDLPLHNYQRDPHAHDVAFDHSGHFLFVPHTRANCIDQFQVDAATGALTLSTPAKLQRGESIGPRHLRFHPHAHFAYGSNEQGLSVSVYQFDPKRGTLNEIQTIASMPPEHPGKKSTSHVEVHPSGNYVYVANRGHRSLAVFQADQTTGKLTFLQRVPIGSQTRSFNVSPDGRFIVAADPKSGETYCYQVTRDAKTERSDEAKSIPGKLILTDAIATGPASWWVAFFPVGN
ncbi:lactonase family protein [Planctomycetes bacterium K23_9]|uniref:6-phosphogluconolactonase n=1 Tax=Stieleria marina TaxID=1930275 RepID=A0A517NRL1_9BACT|nr:6-phosphogluconolactonase [Planctomycetes bacterium K23_9]